MGDIVSLLSSPKRYVWAPREDITTFELAACLAVLLTSVSGAGAGAVESAYNALPDAAKRHWIDDGATAQYG